MHKCMLNVQMLQLYYNSTATVISVKLLWDNAIQINWIGYICYFILGRENISFISNWFWVYGCGIVILSIKALVWMESFF